MDSGRNLRQLTFLVIKDYSVNSGMVEDTVTIWTRKDDAACGIDIPVGEEALIFADTVFSATGKPEGALFTGLCQPNFRENGLQWALTNLNEALGIRSRTAKPAPRAGSRSVGECGQILLDGRIQANGVLRDGAKVR